MSWLCYSCPTVGFGFSTGVSVNLSTRERWSSKTKIDKTATAAIKSIDASKLATLNEQTGKTFTLTVGCGTTCPTFVFTQGQSHRGSVSHHVGHTWLVVRACLVLLKHTKAMGERVCSKKIWMILLNLTYISFCVFILREYHDTNLQAVFTLQLCYMHEYYCSTRTVKLDNLLLILYIVILLIFLCAR